MANDLTIALLDHELADDELAWVSGVHADFAEVRFRRH